ncbi:hypothetical protein [Streptomyces sp. ISL-1]|uniref:hypothetical protein n=1 Tax=Streptomyces sp. ISL-1 TaxID=2817657 RepID=UPI001BE7CBE5|nr:hypothetical protein [Streptomyces sp. ISL-1]
MDLRAAVVGLLAAASKSVGGVSDGEFAAGGRHLLNLGFTFESRSRGLRRRRVCVAGEGVCRDAVSRAATGCLSERSSTSATWARAAAP